MKRTNMYIGESVVLLTRFAFRRSKLVAAVWQCSGQRQRASNAVNHQSASVRASLAGVATQGRLVCRTLHALNAKALSPPPPGSTVAASGGGRIHSSGSVGCSAPGATR